MMRHVLVTGGFGFIGSHLVARLVQEDDTHVHVVDDLSTSLYDAPSVTDAIARRPGALTCDVDTIAGWARRSCPWRFDEIYHLASIVGPVGVLPHAGRIVGRVIEDLSCVMERARSDDARLCDVSTSEVYGGGRRGACAEADPKTIPAEVTIRLEYAVAKLAGEIALINAARASGLGAVIVRPFNVAGPGQSRDGGFVLPRFVHQALWGQPLTVYGDGAAVRAFTHVQDIADGLIRAIRRFDRSLASAPVYNLGNAANRTTILDLARRVLRVTGSASPIRHVDPRDLHGPLFAEAGDKFPDGDLADRELDWHPSAGLDQIVSDTVDWMRGARPASPASPARSGEHA